MNSLSLSRRQMLGSTAALGLSTLVAPTLALAATGSNQRVPGVQLYTVRASMATDVPGTLRAIAGIGYKEVEFAGYFDHSPQQIRGLLDDLGLSSPSVHVDAPAMRDVARRAWLRFWVTGADHNPIIYRLEPSRNKLNNLSV